MAAGFKTAALDVKSSAPDLQTTVAGVKSTVHEKKSAVPGVKSRRVLSTVITDKYFSLFHNFVHLGFTEYDLCSVCHM